MSKVYERKVRITDEQLTSFESPQASVTAVLRSAVLEITRQHHTEPDPEVRGSTWAITRWYDPKTNNHVFTVYCGAEFDVTQHVHPRRKPMITAMTHNAIQESVADLLRRRA